MYSLQLNAFESSSVNGDAIYLEKRKMLVSEVPEFLVPGASCFCFGYHRTSCMQDNELLAHWNYYQPNEDSMLDNTRRLKGMQRGSGSLSCCVWKELNAAIIDQVPRFINNLSC